MLGNLFTQKKPASDSQQPTAPVQNQQDQLAQQTPQQTLPTQQPDVIGSTMDPSRRQDLSALSHLDVRSTGVLNHAKQETVKIKQALIEPEQILLGLLFDEEVFKLLDSFSVDAAKLSREIQSKETQGSFSGQPQLSDKTKQVFENAFRSAKDRGSDFLSPEDLLIVLFSMQGNASSALNSQGLSKEKLEEKLSKTTEFSTRKTTLERYGIDLTEQARSGTLDPIFGRDKEIERLIHILLRRTKNNPIIIGEAGVGKTAIVEGVAQKIIEGSVPKDMVSKRVIQLDMTSLVAGASHRGEFEERLRGVIKDAMASSGQLILFIDEIHTLIGAGDTEGSMDASNIVKPFLARGQLQIIGTTTTAEFRKYFEKDKAFERRFQPIMCEEPDEETAVGMLKILQPKYEKFHNVTYEEEAVKAAVSLSKKYIGERFLPDKGVDLLDEAGAQVKLKHQKGEREDGVVKKSDIEQVVSNWTGIPITRLTEDESEKLLKLEELIHKRLIDQEEAVTAVAEAVRRGRIGLAAANRPIASFVFLGPTGVGKTELAKTLADILFGREDLTIRLDMSEYMEKHEVAKLIGAPPGYVGYEEGGQLTEAVRAKPYSIVLLDEVEKAHPDVFNILLQLLEDGRLTDNKGNTISFKNTIVIATSNIGSSLIQQHLSQKQDAGQQTQQPVQSSTGDSTQSQQTTEEKTFAELQNLLVGELHKFFKPELLNRFDGVVVFKPLRKEDMKAIAKNNIEKTGKLLTEQGFSLQITDGGLVQLADEGYDPVYGARPLRRLIQTSIENPIALQIISRQFASGDTILVDYDKTKEEFVFQKGTPQPQVSQDPTQLPVDPSQPTGDAAQIPQAGSIPQVGNAPQPAVQNPYDQVYSQTPQPSQQTPTDPSNQPMIQNTQPQQGSQEEPPPSNSTFQAQNSV